jgi:hypothetical protein
MQKSELLQWFQGEVQQWNALLDHIGMARMEQSGVNGDWSMKDMIAHLTGWNRKLVAGILALQRGEPEPPPPWPDHLDTDDAVNVWLYESNRERPLRDVLDESQQVFQQLLTVVEALPEDVAIETVQQGGRAYYLVYLNDQRIQPGEFFDHFHDDHEPDVRAWLARVAQR